MKKQDYKNYRQYYPPHHFIFLPLIGFLTFFGAYKAFTSDEDMLVWTLFSIVCFCIIYLTLMLRQHYALGNQDRIVRLEFRLRYFQLMNQSSAEAEQKLSFAQIKALRFAGDSEFPQLLEKALNENLSPEKIKESIQDWQADTMRV